MSYQRSARHPSPGQIEAFGLGHIAQAEALVIEDHLAACEACLDRLSSFDGRDDPLLRLLHDSGEPTRPLELRQESETRRPPPIPIGYEWIEPIGRGGMGVVHKARQLALGRVVAIKQLSAGIDASAQELDRFRVEVEAVAQLRHPNIVQVFDVGLRDGMPFLAMEYLAGGTLAARLSAGPLQPIEAAAIVEALARGVEHAHGFSIIHRDLKPGNVLLDEDGTPKVTDFGLARRLDDPSNRTRTGALLGTPSYMAPEQADPGRVAVGPSADIYALGAILYDCLAGRPPFLGASPLDTLDLVRLGDPAPPRRLQPSIPRDLETICLACLRRDPRRRPASAAALAEELARFRRGEPIRSRPVGPIERLALWSRRRPSQAVAALTLLLALIGLVAGGLLHNARLQNQIAQTQAAAQAAERAGERAVANYRQARAAIRAMLDRLETHALAGTPRLSELQRDQAQDALDFYQAALARAPAVDPEIRLDTAEAHIEAAALQMLLGRDEQAEPNLRRALALLNTEPNEDTAAVSARINASNKLGLLLSHRRDGEAIEWNRRALTLANQLDAADPNNSKHQGQLAWCLHNLAANLIGFGRGAEAEPFLRDAITIRETMLRAQPDRIELRLVLAEGLVNLALLDASASRREQAEAGSRRADELLRPLLEGTRAEVARLALADLLLNWGNLDASGGRFDDAIARFAEGITLVETVMAAEPGWTRPRLTARNLHGARAQCLSALDRPAEAADEWTAGLELADDDSSRTLFRIGQALALARSGNLADAFQIAETVATRTDLDPTHIYNLSCIFALLAKTTSLSSDSASQAETLKRRAVQLLELACESGFLLDPNRIALIQSDTDLGALADYRPFVDLLERLATLESVGRPR